MWQLSSFLRRHTQSRNNSSHAQTLSLPFSPSRTARGPYTEAPHYLRAQTTLRLFAGLLPSDSSRQPMTLDQSLSSPSGSDRTHAFPKASPPHHTFSI